MKFVLSYTVNIGGSAAERVRSGEAAQKLLSSWTPSEKATIHQWLQRCDGNGGFSVIETDDAAAMFKDLATWSPWLTFEVFPVLDIGDSAPLQQEAIDAAKGVL